MRSCYRIYYSYMENISNLLSPHFRQWWYNERKAHVNWNRFIFFGQNNINILFKLLSGTWPHYYPEFILCNSNSCFCIYFCHSHIVNFVYEMMWLLYIIPEFIWIVIRYTWKGANSNVQTPPLYHTIKKSMQCMW